MDTLWLIAGDRDAGNAELHRLKVLQMPDGTFVLPDSSAKVVPIVRDPDMRGRTVNVHDVILVIGSWLGRRDHEVEWLVNQFNACRVDDTAPLLQFRKGEAPLMAYPEDVRMLNGEQVWPTRVPTYTLTINGENIPVTEIHLDTTSDDVTVVASTAPIKGEWVLNARGLRELVTLTQKAMDSLTKKQDELEQWLSGVQPVEDTEIPGIFWCGVCGGRLPAHAEGCPAAEDAAGGSTLKS